MEEHFAQMPIQDGHQLVATGINARGARRGEDTDIYTYDEIGPDSVVVATWEVEDSRSIHPPFHRRIDAVRTPVA